jgi:hypothetical protein
MLFNDIHTAQDWIKFFKNGLFYFFRHINYWSNSFNLLLKELCSRLVSDESIHYFFTSLTNVRYFNDFAFENRQNFHRVEFFPEFSK